MSLVFSTSREATFKDGCLSLRKSTLDKLTANIAPGPIYSPKARVSSSASEKRLRDITFGTGPARLEPVESWSADEPGPHTYDPNLIRMARVNGLKNPIGVRFSTGPRVHKDVLLGKGPSPQEYDPEMIRKGITNTKSGSTSVKFGTGPARYNDMKSGMATPGPQAYDPGAIKRGIMFTKRSMPSVKIGKPPSSPAHPPCKKERSSDEIRVSDGSGETGNHATRHQQQPRGITPGPQEYDTESIRNGLLLLSKNRRPAGVKFGTGPRAYDSGEKARGAVPGPSSYGVPSSLGPQVSSRYRSQPQMSFGAR